MTQSPLNIDFIGDIHGHATQLKNLLIKMGYSLQNGFYQHPSRKVVFLGDYIDRGPEIPQTLHMVKSMVDGGSARALMGNHEFNALAFNHLKSTGGYLRPHKIVNFKQHSQTLLQFHNKQEEYNQWIEWMKSLPLYIEDDNWRAVHATWNQDQINILNQYLQNQRLTDELLSTYENKESVFTKALDVTLKGEEAKLPPGKSYKDKDGTIRAKCRIKWWISTKNKTYSEIKFDPAEFDINEIFTEGKDTYYQKHERPVFFGHYWLQGAPYLQQENTCCLDYSVAKNGKLVAYRFNGEKTLDPASFVF